MENVNSIKFFFIILMLFIFSLTSSAQIEINKQKINDSKSSLLISELSVDNKIAVKKQKDFTFSTNLYFLALSLSGSVALPVNRPELTITQTPILDVNLKFSDAIKNLKFAFMLGGKFIYKNVGLLYDVNYVKLGYDGSVPIQSNYLSGTLTTKLFNGDFALLYRFPLKNKNIRISGYAGTRIFSMNNIIDLVYIDNTILSVDKAKTWADPIIGADIKIDVSKHWMFYLKSDAGGFGISSKFTGSLLLTAGYKFSEQWNTNFGFKYIYTDYEKDNFLWKISQYGLLLSFGYMFK